MRVKVAGSAPALTHPPLTTQPMQTLRIPRGLWNDLEETVIQQDRLFLTEVARSLGLPLQEVLRRCLGTGAPQPCPVLWMPLNTQEPDACPWWECHGSLWRRCPRVRLSPTLPCAIHERCTPCPLARLDDDPVIRALPWRIPVRVGNRCLWVDPTGQAPTLREDGYPETEGVVRWITHRGARIPAWQANPRPESGYAGDDDAN